MERYSSGELDMLPAKRKLSPLGSPCGGQLGAAGECAAPAPAAAPQAPHHHHREQPQLQRASCGLGCTPAMSSPAFGAWGLRGGSTGGSMSSDTPQASADLDSCHTAESARAGKSLRMCSEAAAAALAPASEACADASCQGGAGCGPLGPYSLPPGMYRSYHLGCCSRMSSSSSLTELEAAAAAVRIDPEADPAATAAVAVGAAAAAAADEPASSSPAAATAAAQAAVRTVEVTASALAAAAASRPQQGNWPPPSPFCSGSPHLQQQQQQQQLHWNDQQQMEWECEEEEQQASVFSYWHDVPDDILKRVLEKLQPSTLRVLRLVCRGWEAAASRLLRHLRPEAIVGKHLGQRFPALHSLDLSNAAMGVDFTTPRMLRLQSLLLDEHLAELAGLARLEQLSLRGCNRISGMGLAQLGRLTSLSMLNLSNCTGLRDECLAALAAAAPQLSTLNLQGCSRLGDDGIAHLASMTNLRHVLLPAGVSDACIATLIELPALERVALRGCTKVSTAGIYLLLQRRGLKRVVISKCPQITLEALCMGGNGLEGAKLITAEAASAAAAAAAAAGVPPGPGLVGQDMQLLVGDA